MGHNNFRNPTPRFVQIRPLIFTDSNSDTLITGRSDLQNTSPQSGGRIWNPRYRILRNQGVGFEGSDFRKYVAVKVKLKVFESLGVYFLWRHRYVGNLPRTGPSVPRRRRRQRRAALRAQGWVSHHPARDRTLAGMMASRRRVPQESRWTRVKGCHYSISGDMRGYQTGEICPLNKLS